MYFYYSITFFSLREIFLKSSFPGTIVHNFFYSSNDIAVRSRMHVQKFRM